MQSRLAVQAMSDSMAHLLCLRHAVADGNTAEIQTQAHFMHTPMFAATPHVASSYPASAARPCPLGIFLAEGSSSSFLE